MAYKPGNQPHRGEPKKTPYHISLRIHRALSWLHRAKTCESDLDGRFMFLWSPFNAPNCEKKGKEMDKKECQKEGMEECKKMVKKDGKKKCKKKLKKKTMKKATRPSDKPT
jgi:hypothetical protein